MPVVYTVSGGEPSGRSEGCKAAMDYIMEHVYQAEQRNQKIYGVDDVIDLMEKCPKRPIVFHNGCRDPWKVAVRYFWRRLVKNDFIISEEIGEEEEAEFEDCEDCGFTHPTEDKCPQGSRCRMYEKWRKDEEDEESDKE
jgi:hypothetical protein